MRQLYRGEIRAKEAMNTFILSGYERSSSRPIRLLLNEVPIKPNAWLGSIFYKKINKRLKYGEREQSSGAYYTDTQEFVYICYRESASVAIGGCGTLISIDSTYKSIDCVILVAGVRRFQIIVSVRSVSKQITYGNSPDMLFTLSEQEHC